MAAFFSRILKHFSMAVTTKSKKIGLPKVAKKKATVKPGAKRKPAAKKTVPLKQAAATKQSSKDIAAGYNAFKQFNGEYYTGMKIGRSHKWYYDKGTWKETKMTPDMWNIDFEVTKRRAGKAPEGSGVPVGTEYNWYIVAHQLVKKLNANDYSTSLKGVKYKLAHRRADKEKWSITERGQKKRMIKLLKDLIAQLESEVAA
jgi:hypothetical protein